MTAADELRNTVPPRMPVVRAPKTAELVAQHLRRRIVRGDLAEGEALPPESELIDMFSVSRPTLREAFRVLEAERLLSIRRGARGGARVHRPDPDVAARYAGLVLEFEGTTLADVYHARTTVEAPCAAVLAREHTAEDLDRLWASVEQGEAYGDDYRGLIRHHTEFHALVVDLAGNHTMRLLNRMLRQIIDVANWTRVDHGVDQDATAHAFRHGVKAHRRLVELIEKSDEDGARRIWTKHLVEANEYLSGLPNATTVLDLLE